MGPGSQAALSGRAAPPGARTLTGWTRLFLARPREEAFFWPQNNTRVSPGTSLLHPLPSIVSATQSQATGLYVAGGGGGVQGGEQERLAVSNVCDTSGLPPLPRLGQGSADSRWTDRPSLCAWPERPCAPQRACQQGEATGWVTPLPPLAPLNHSCQG